MHAFKHFILSVATAAIAPVGFAQLSVGIADQSLDRNATTTGSFLVAITSGTASGIDGYDLEFEILPQSGASGTLTLTGVANPTISPLFATGDPLFVAASGGFPDYVGDSSTVEANAAVGVNLVEVLYAVSNDAAGDFLVSFVGDIDSIFASGNNVLDSTNNGTISVLVPEPGAAAVLLAMSCVVWHRRRTS